MDLFKRIGFKLATLSIIFALNVIIPAHAVVLTGHVQPLGESFSQELDDSIRDLLERRRSLKSFVENAVQPMFHGLHGDPAFMARVKATRDLDKFKFNWVSDKLYGRKAKVENLRRLAMTVSAEVRRYIHRYDDLDRDGHEFAANGENWSVQVWYNNQAYTRTPYFAFIKEILEKPVVWSAESDALVTFGMLLSRVPEADLTWDEKALLNTHTALNRNAALQIEPLDADEFLEILRHPRIPEIIRDMKFATDPLAVLVPRSEEVTTLVILRPRSRLDDLGDAVGERFSDDRVRLYKIDFNGGVKIDPFMHIGYRDKSNPRLFLPPQPMPCSKHVANEWSVF